MSTSKLKFIFIIIIGYSYSNIFLHAEDKSGFYYQDSSTRYFYEPYPMKTGEYLMQLGASFTILPIPLVENEYPTPALDFQFKYGVPLNLSLNGTASTNYFTNLLHGGLQWSYNIEDFSFGISQNFGGFFGFIEMEGQFDDNSAYAVFYMPIMRFAYRFEEMAVSVSFVTTYLVDVESKVSGIRVQDIANSWNDFFCTIAFEQPFSKQQLLSFGFSLNYAKTPYQSWMLYNTNDEFIYLPEFFFAFHL